VLVSFPFFIFILRTNKYGYVGLLYPEAWALSQTNTQWLDNKKRQNKKNSPLRSPTAALWLSFSP